MRLITTPKILRMFYPSFLWEMPKGEKKIYITFDDGPHPTITPQVLEILKNFNAKATFFCVGNNVKKYKETFELIKNEGHSVGSHTFNHERGFMTKTKDYVNSVIEADALIQSPLFRPPHGRIKFSQIKSLKKKFRISATVVMNLFLQCIDLGQQLLRCLQLRASAAPQSIYRQLQSRANSLIVFQKQRAAVLQKL